MVTSFKGPTPLPGALIQRIVAAAMISGNSPLWATRAGRALLEGKIDKRQLGIADYIRQTYKRYDLHADHPSRVARSPSYEDRGRRRAQWDDPEAYGLAKATWDELQNILKVFNSRYRGLIEDWCVDDVHINAVALADVRVVLDYVGGQLTRVRGRKRKPSTTPQAYHAAGAKPVRDSHLTDPKAAADRAATVALLEGRRKAKEP